MFVVHLDIYGFWLGIIAAETITNTLLFILIARFNWESHAKAALIRIKFNPNSKTNDISIVTSNNTNDEKMNKESLNDSENDNISIKSLGIKISVLSLFIIFLIAGIITSKVIPL